MTQQRGFTLVELMVVIVVIAIIATIAILGVDRYIQDGRDTRRASNVTAIAEALEKYYNKTGEYPGCAEISAPGPTVATTVLTGLDESALIVPEAEEDVTNSIRCGTTVTLNAGGVRDDFIEYRGDNSPTCFGAGPCPYFTLRYRSEVTDTVLEIKSRRGL